MSITPAPSPDEPQRPWLRIQAEPQRGYWRDLDEDARIALMRTAEFTVGIPGQVLLPPDDSTGDVLIVWTGLVKLVVYKGRTQIVLALRGPGDVVGELAGITGNPRSAAVVCTGPVAVLRIRGEEFVDFLRHFPAADEVLRRTVAERLGEADRDRFAAATMNVGQRLARFLLNLMKHYGIPAPGGGVKLEPLSQQDLAGCVGGAQRTVAREMSDWRARGFISTSRLSVTIHEPESLRRIAGRHAPPP
jgi:CRP-like cAMP-binding protein